MKYFEKTMYTTRINVLGKQFDMHLINVDCQGYPSLGLFLNVPNMPVYDCGTGVPDIDNNSGTNCNRDTVSDIFEMYMNPTNLYPILIDMDASNFDYFEDFNLCIKVNTKAPKWLRDLVDEDTREIASFRIYDDLARHGSNIYDVLEYLKFSFEDR